MVIEGNSDIIKSCQFKPANDAHEACQWLVFRNDMVLVISKAYMALYKGESSIFDPLGNGLKASVDFEEELAFNEQGFVERYAAGFVGLLNGKAILITPNDIQLFANNHDALRNQNELARLELA